MNSSDGEKVTDSVSIQLLLYVYFHMNISKERPIFKVADVIPKPEIENNNLTLFNEEIILNEGTDFNIFPDNTVLFIPLVVLNFQIEQDDSEISQIDKLARLCVRSEFGAQKLPDDIKLNFLTP